MADKRISGLTRTATSFESDDFIVTDSPTWNTRKMSQADLKQIIKDTVFDSYAEWVESLPARTAAKSGDKSVVSNSIDGPGSETNGAQAQKVLAGNIAPAFDPTKPNDVGGKAYYAGQKVVNNGETYLFILDKTTGAWDASYAVRTDALKLFEPKRHFSSDDLILGYYIGGSVGSKVTKKQYSSTYAGNGFVVIPVTEGERVKIKSLTDSSAPSNFIVTDGDFVVLYNSGRDETVGKEFIYDVSTNGYVICNSLPSNFSFTGLYDEAEIKTRMSKSFENKVSFGGIDLEIGWAYRNDPVTKVQPSVSYRDTGCMQISVKAGEMLTIKGSPSTTDYVIILTDSSNNVITTYAKGTLDALTSIYIETDGFAFINSLPENFECYHLTLLEKDAIGSMKNETKYSYSDLASGKTFASANIGTQAPAISGSGLNRAMAINVSAGDLLTITSKIQGSANLLYLTDKNNVIRSAYTNEMVASKIRVKYDGQALVSCENGGTFSLVHSKGKPLQFNLEKPLSRNQLPADGSEGSVFDAESMTSQDIYNALDALTAKYPFLLTSKTLGKDASGTFDVKEYVFAQRAFLAWERDNYPKMYAFKNGYTTVYSDKPSPRVGDSLYSTAYIGTAAATVSSVSPNAWTLSDANEYERVPSADVEPTLIYTMVGDGLHVYYSNGYYRNASATQSGDDIVYSGNTYHRNHLYDTKRGEDYDYKICIGCAEHGPTTDPRDTAITLYNLIHDLCENESSNEFLSVLRNNAMIAFIPIINPWGFDDGVNGRRNYNGVNINRNYNTPGWSNLQEDPGAYPGSEIETQYAMGLFAKRAWDGSMSIHCLGNGNNGKVIMLGALSVDPTLDIANVLNYYGLLITVRISDNPETSCTSNAYQKLVGTTGVLIELNRGPDSGDKHTAVIETMNCSYLMLTLWYLMSLKKYL